MLNAKRHWENINLLSRDAGYYLTTAPPVCVEALVLIAQAIAKSHGADPELKTCDYHCCRNVLCGQANVGLIRDGQIRFGLAWQNWGWRGLCLGWPELPIAGIRFGRQVCFEAGAGTIEARLRVDPRPTKRRFKVANDRRKVVPRPAKHQPQGQTVANGSKKVASRLQIGCKWSQMAAKRLQTGCK